MERDQNTIVQLKTQLAELVDANFDDHSLSLSK